MRVKGRGEGGSGPNFFKQVFEITVDPKGLSSGPTFWSGLEAPNPFAKIFEKLANILESLIKNPASFLHREFNCVTATQIIMEKY